MHVCVCVSMCVGACVYAHSPSAERNDEIELEYAIVNELGHEINDVKSYEIKCSALNRGNPISLKQASDRLPSFKANHNEVLTVALLQTKAQGRQTISECDVTIDIKAGMPASLSCKLLTYVQLYAHMDV